MSFWTDRLVQDLAQKALELNKRFCGSRAISESFTILEYRVDPPHIEIYSPYYWAVYYKEGVDFIRFPKKSPWLIWYKNPEDDPRIAPVPRGYPVRRSDVRSFTDLEFKQARKDQKTGKAFFALAAGPIPAHDWTPKTFFFWSLYAEFKIKEEMKRRIKSILQPLRGLKIGS